MDLLHNLALGFSVLADPMTIVYSLIGVVCGAVSYTHLTLPTNREV